MTHRSLGRMRSEDFERMRSKYTYMIESITKPDPLLNLLFTKGVLDTHDIERINNAKRYDDGLEKSRVRKLLDILMIERGGSFQMFLQCLDETGYDYISLEVENGTGSKSEIKVPIIGKTGSGKSLLGNFLMKKNFFRTSGSNTSLTNVCQAGEVQIDETTKVSFIDTPGLFDTKETIAETVSKYIDLFAIGNVDVFLIVVRADVKFTKEERDTLKSIRDIFGSDIKKHSLVVFNNHKTKAKTLDKLTTVKDVEKLDIVRKDRFVLVNHLSEEDEENENEEILEVLHQIRKIVQENDGQQYTNRMYRLTEQKCQESQKNERMLEHENMHLKSETQYLKSEMTRADSLQHEINAMKIKMDELQSTQQENDLSQIREKTRLETQNAVLQSQMVSLQAFQSQKKEEIDAENLRIKNENDLLRTELDKMKLLKESDSLKEGQIGVLKERLKIENENNERKLASMREEIERLVSSKAILKNKFENSEKLYIELKEHENRQNIELKQIKQTNDELKVKTQKCEDLKSEEVSKLKMQVLQYEKKLEAITEENSQMLHQNDNLKTQRENLEDRVKELQKKEDIKSQEENGYLEKIRNLEYLRKELKEEKEESEKIKRKNSILQEEIIKINLKYEINLKQMENLKCQLEETYINKTKSDQLNIEQTKLTTDLGVVNRDLSSQNKELNTKLKDAEEMITEIEETKAKITDEKEKLIHECKRLETELKLQNDTYLENSKTHENEKIKLSKEITELKSDCRQGINIIEKYKKKNAGLAEGITKLEKENTRLAESIKLQTTKNEEDAWEISELSNELEELRKQGMELRHKIKLIEDKNEELTKSISENEIDKIQIVDENEKKISELKLSRNELSSSLEEITHEKEKLTKVVEELLENKQECLNELAKRKAKVEELCCTIEKLKDEAKGLGDRNRELENSNSNLKSEYELQTHKCSELENNVRTMEGNYKHSVNETEKLLNEIKVETSQKTLLGILMKNSEFLKREEIKGLRKELARYKTLSCVKTREAERLKRNYKNLEQMKCDLESMVQKNQEHYERINSKHGEIMDENTNIRIELVTIEEKMEIIRTRMGIFAKRCDEGTGATQSIKREAKEPTLLENISKDETCESFHKKPNVTAPSCTVVAPRIQVQCKMKSQHACVVEPGTKGQLEKEDLIPLSADTICDKTDQIEWENEKLEESFKEFHQSAEEIERMIEKTKSKSDDNYTRFNSLNIGEGLKYSDTLVSRLISKKIKEPKAKINMKTGNNSKNKKSPGSSQLPKLKANVIPEKKSSMNIFLKLIICLTVLLFLFLFQYFPKEIVFVGITVLLYNILSGIMYIMKSPKIFRTMHVGLYESEKPDSDESTALPVVQKATTTSQTQIEMLAKSSLVDKPTTLTEAETEELTTLHKSVNLVLESSNSKSLEDENLTTPQAEESNLTETETKTICEMRKHRVVEAETLMALPEDKNAISAPQIEKSTGEKATAGPISEESSVDNPTTLTEAETKELTTLCESDKPSLPTNASKLRVVESSKAKSLEDEKPTTPPAEDTSLTEAETKKLTTLHESVKPALPTDNSKLPVLESSSTESLQDGKPTTPRGPAETTTLPRTEKITTQIPSTLHDAKKEVTLDQAEKTTSHEAEKLCEMRERGVVEAETLVTLPEDENAISPPQIEKSAISSNVEKPIKCHDSGAAVPPEGEEAVTQQETITLSKTDTSSTLPEDQNVTSPAQTGIQAPPTHQDIKTHVHNEASESPSTGDESGMITGEKATTNETEEKTTQPQAEKSTAGPISEESSVDKPTTLTEAETKELTTLRESDKPSLPTDASKLRVVESSKAKSLEDEKPETRPPVENTSLTEYGTKKLTTLHESVKPALPTDNSKLPVLESSSTESLQDGKPTTPRGPAETTTLPRTEK